ncbi:MAG: ABC transporter ATP-binding protein [Magnetococcales bacterium]|nr:ABC transporter ATP-binding protein [Magnetococcales bacterium]
MAVASEPPVTAPLLALQEVDLGVGERRFCRKLDWSVRPRERWAVLGPNGAGKSTLLHALAGLQPVDGGEIFLEGRPLRALSRRAVARRVGILFQEQEYPFPATVLECVLAGRTPHVPFWARDTMDDHQLALDALRETGLEALAHRQVETLSGGERRRMEAATLLVQSPRLLLLDEPTNHLDLGHQIGLLELLVRKTAASNGAMILVLHDINLAARFCDRFLFLFGSGESLMGDREQMLQPALLSRLFRHPMRAVAWGERGFWMPE